MTKIAGLIVLSCIAATVIFALTQVGSVADGSGTACATASKFLATPFVASDQAHRHDFTAGIVSGVSRAYSVSTKPSAGTPGAVRSGNYAGIVLIPTMVVDDFQNLSFSLKGPASTQVTVHSRRPGVHAYNYSWAAAGKGIKAKTKQDGAYQPVSLDAQQLFVEPGSMVDRIVISTDSREKSASFNVSDLRVNGQPVGLSLDSSTRYYDIVSGGPTGPVVSASTISTPQPTSWSVINLTKATQYFYLTITPSGSYTDQQVQQVSDVTSLGSLTLTAKHPALPGEGTLNTIDSTNAYFFLQPKNKLTWSPSAFTTGGGTTAYTMFSGNVFVNGTQGTNDSQCDFTNSTPQGAGATYAEVTLNVDGNALTLETADISEVNGVNAIYEMHLPMPPSKQLTPGNPYYAYYFDTTSFWNGVQNTSLTTPWGAYPYHTFVPVPSIRNKPGYYPFGGDKSAVLPYGMISDNSVTTGNPGVYPMGCSVCTGGPAGLCSAGYPPPSDTAQQLNICQVSRSYLYEIGGTVEIRLVEFPHEQKPKPKPPGFGRRR